MIIKDEQKLFKSPLVTVQVYAYNKEAFVRECLDSVLSQYSDFEYEVIISVNPGTDKTADICIEYQKNNPEKVILVLRERNMGFFYNYYAAERMSRGKYITRCDGDDYWCDDQKLKKQVAFMEANPNLGSCYTMCRIYDESNHCFRKNLMGDEYYGFKAMLRSYPIPQPAVMYRHDLTIQYLDDFKPEQYDWIMEDVPRQLWIGWHSDIKRMDEITAVYRVVQDSASHRVDFDKQAKYYESVYECKSLFAKMCCPEDSKLERDIFNFHSLKMISLCLQFHDVGKAWGYVKRYKYRNLMDLIKNIYYFLKIVFLAGYDKLLKHN